MPRRLVSRWCIATACVVLAASLVLAQKPSPSPPTSADTNASPITFEVISVKLNKSGGSSSSFGFPPNSDRFVANDAFLLPLIQLAYGLEGTPMSTARVIGAPRWLESARYDIEAKIAAADVPRLRGLTPPQTMLLLKPLLEDRFKLQAHVEQRDYPQYALVVARGGPKLKEATPGDTYPDGLKGPNGPSGAGQTRALPGDVIGQAITMARLAQILRTQVGRPVVDRTGLTARYDLHLSFTPGSGLNAEASVDGEPQESIFSAIQEQLGLRLEAIHAPADFLIIDHIEQPGEN